MDLDMAPWHVSTIFDSIDDQYSYWDTLLASIINDHAPLKKNESACEGRTIYDARVEKGNQKKEETRQEICKKPY